MKRIRSIDFIFRKHQFATDIAASRIELGMTQIEVASHVGLSGSAISDYESAHEDNMKLQNFLNLCNLFDLNPHEYFELSE